MTTNAELVAQYYHLRELSQDIGESLVGLLTDDVMAEGARKLGMHKNGVPKYETDDELAVLVDYCIFDIRRHGRNAVQRYLIMAPPSNPESAMVLDAMLRARYSLFEVEEVVPGVGVQLRDLVRGDRQFTMEVGYSASAQKGEVLATRIFTPDTFAMTTGAAMPRGKIEDRDTLDQQMRQTFAKMGIDLDKHLTPEQESRMATAFIRSCLKHGALSQVVYEAPPGSKDDIQLPSGSKWDLATLSGSKWDIGLHTAVLPVPPPAPARAAPADHESTEVRKHE